MQFPGLCPSIGDSAGPGGKCATSQGWYPSSSCPSSKPSDAQPSPAGSLPAKCLPLGLVGMGEHRAGPSSISLNLSCSEFQGQGQTWRSSALSLPLSLGRMSILVEVS